jgi:DNA repair ATPase RecN
MDDEYELVPLSPIRRLEKRLERIERSGTSQETIHDLVEVVRANQHVIDDIVKMNSDMLNKVTELVNKVTAMTDKVTDFMERLEVSGGGEESSAASDDTKRFEEKLTKMEKKINALILSGMPVKRRVTPPAQY